jgi:hypothetical protein
MLIQPILNLGTSRRLCLCMALPMTSRDLCLLISYRDLKRWSLPLGYFSKRYTTWRHSCGLPQPENMYFIIRTLKTQTWAVQLHIFFLLPPSPLYRTRNWLWKNVGIWELHHRPCLFQPASGIWPGPFPGGTLGFGYRDSFTCICLPGPYSLASAFTMFQAAWGWISTQTERSLTLMESFVWSQATAVVPRDGSVLPYLVEEVQPLALLAKPQWPGKFPPLAQ